MRRLAACAAALLLLGACAEEAPDSADTGDDELLEAIVAPEDPPTVGVPEDEAPPGELVVEELAAGDGPRVAEGDVITAHLVAVSWESGEQVASSWDHGAPRTFATDQLIPGVRDGVVGMRVGERRRIVVPPELGYGEDAPAGIDPEHTLVFVFDLVSVG